MIRRIRTATLAVIILAVPVFLLAQAASPSATSAPASAAASANALRVAAGENVVLELADSLNTRSSLTGDRAHFTTFQDVLVGYQVAIPRGSSVRATLTKVKKPGRRGKAGQIRLQFDEIVLPDGTTLSLPATLVRAGFTIVRNSKTGASVKGEGGAGKRDAIGVAMNAGTGALIGAGIGGGKGAAYGGAIGAGIGVLQLWLRRGPHLDLPRGMLFEVVLDQELEIPAQTVAYVAQHTPPAGAAFPGAASPTRPSSSGTFSFPDDPADASAVDDIPDFDTQDTTTVATDTDPSGSLPPPTPQLPAPPAPVPPTLDPTLGDPGAYTLRVDVRQVVVEAFVRDNSGRPVDDLTREDFRIVEDGVEQKVSYFSRDELPLAVALVVDRSGSVARFMGELRRAAYQTLTELKPGDQVALFSFASEVERLEDLTTDRRRIAERIARIRAGGGTNITDALFAAAHYLGLAARGQRRAIILISDNNATTSGFATQSRTIRRALESEVVIYSVKTPGDPTPLMLRLPAWVSGSGSVKKITRETGGEIIDVQRVGSLQAALAAVVTRLKTRYTLGYNSTNKARDGGFRAIKVHLADQYGRAGNDYRVLHRRGYYAPDQRVAAQTPAPR